MFINSTIFVSIASYRDPELLFTLENMLIEASNPRRLYISVCWQDNEDISIFLNKGMILLESRQYLEHQLFVFSWYGARINIVAVNYFFSKGAGWARYIVTTLFKQEHYFLQIDSHMRFIHHWDEEMIDMLEKLRSQSQWPIISHYPPGYEPTDSGDTRADYVCRIIFNGFTKDGIVQLYSTMLTNNDFTPISPVPTCYIAAGFFFSDGHFLNNVPYDPDIFFLGEEIALSACAFTRGYDIWSPHKILVWHFYVRAERNCFWGDHTEKAKEEGRVDYVWWERDAISKNKVLKLLTDHNTTSDDPSTTLVLGSKRSLLEYEYRSGINFTYRAVHPDIVNVSKQVSFFETLPEDHNVWFNQLRCVALVSFDFTLEELSFKTKNVAWWHVGIYDDTNQALLQEQWSRERFKTEFLLLDKKTCRIHKMFLTQIPKQGTIFRICPYISDSGWGKVVEKLL